MRTFGDHTPKDDLLNWIEYVKDDHHLTWPQLLTLLLQVIAYIAYEHVDRADNDRKPGF